MKKIELSSGAVVLIDDEDVGRVRAYRWHEERRSHTSYAVSNNARPVRMHRLIIGAPSGVQVDHVDRNGLNNQKDNLRLATQSQNLANSRSQRGKSVYKGVTRRSNSWLAHIGVNGKALYLGAFQFEEDAARAYNAAAVRYFGEFARPNAVSITGATLWVFEEARLTPLEVQVGLLYVERGLSYDQIAEQAGLSVAEVRAIVTSIRERVLIWQEAREDPVPDEMEEVLAGLTRRIRRDGQAIG